jgi:HK97 gp10 family phage protein
VILTKLQSRIDDIAKELAEELDPVVEQAAQLVVSRAQVRVPSDSGRLRESIREIKYDTCKYNVVADAKAPTRPNLPYGIFVEYGTQAGGRGGGNQPRQPFLGPATEETERDFLKMVNDKLRDL